MISAAQIGLIFSSASTAISMAETAISLGLDAAPFVKLAGTLIAEKRPMTPAERAWLNGQEDSFRAAIDKQIAEDDAAAG